jgi:uncharacterized membrane protein
MTDKGWIPLVLAFGHIVITLFAVAIAGLTQKLFWFDLISNLMVVGIVIGLLAIVGLYYDRLYVKSVSEWHPSVGYLLLLFVPVVGLFTTALYLYKRHLYVGIP